MSFIPRLNARTDAQDVIQRALGDEGSLALGIGSDHTQPFAHKVVRDFIDFLLSADVDPAFCAAADGFIQWIVQPGLVVRVEIGEIAERLGTAALAHRVRRRDGQLLR